MSAYDMRISYWSSDVCASDLVQPVQMASGVAPIEPTPLVSRTHTPRMQRIADQVGGRLVYIVITALIILPVWVATPSDRKSVVSGKSVSVRVDRGGRLIIKKKTTHT